MKQFTETKPIDERRTIEAVGGKNLLCVSQVLISKFADAFGYLPIAFNSCRSKTCSLLLNPRILAVTAPISLIDLI